MVDVVPVAVVAMPGRSGSGKFVHTLLVKPPDA
jgi:hypothetical protein